MENQLTTQNTKLLGMQLLRKKAALEGLLFPAALLQQISAV